MPITDWPASERPREKLLEQGAQALSDAELLAIFLRTGVAGKTAVDLAQDLLVEFGSLRALLKADQAGFCQAKGLGLAKYAQLQAVLEMSRRHLEEGVRRGQLIQNPKDVEQYLALKMREYPFEIFGCVFLDNQHRVICFEEMFRGTINSANVHPREVLRKAMELNAAALILVHNHPSGCTEPSQADQMITQRLKQVLELIDVRILDHFIVGDRVVSMAERGMV